MSRPVFLEFVGSDGVFLRACEQQRKEKEGAGEIA